MKKVRLDISETQKPIIMATVTSPSVHMSKEPPSIKPKDPTTPKDINLKNTKTPTTFLSLPAELRQAVLYMTYSCPTTFSPIRYLRGDPAKGYFQKLPDDINQ